MHLNLREGTTDGYTLKEVDKYFKYIHPAKEDVWLDCGGNIGCFSVKISELVKQVYTFEPDFGNYHQLLLNLNDNKIFNVFPSRYAVVGNKDTTREFYINLKKSQGIHSFYVKRGRKKVIVGCQNINDIIVREGITKIKIDTEGAEYEIIKAIKDWSKIQEIIFEFHFNVLKDKDYEVPISIADDLSKYFELIGILQSNFRAVVYEPNPKRNWTKLVYAHK